MRYFLIKMLSCWLAIPLSLSHFVHGDDNVPKVDFLELNVSLDSGKFKPIWERLLQSLEFGDLSEGRMVLSEFPSTQTELFSLETPKPPSPPRSLLVCDFSNDFVEMRFRKDWYKTKHKISKSEEKIDGRVGKYLEDRLANSAKIAPSSIPDLKKVSLFQLEQNEELELLSKNVFKLDFSGTYTPPKGTYITSSRRHSGTWPCEIDIRLIGWCRLGQIALPTTSDEWLRILKTFEHYSIEMVDDGKARLVCVERNSELAPEKCWLFDVELDPKRNVKLRSVTTYIAFRDAGQSIFCRAKPEFTSRFFYEKGFVRAVITNDVTRGVGHRFDFELETRNLPEENHFQVLGLGSNANIVFDPSIESALKKSIQSGIESE